tara:strand:+ start:365 stop:628 length:264 start_codon:yes stop_codon:yes gene_type:complete
MAYSKSVDKKAVKKVAKKKVTKKPVKAPVEKKDKVTPVEPSKPSKAPSESKRRYKARPKALSPVDNRKVPSSYAKSKSSKRHPNIIG